MNEYVLVTGAAGLIGSQVCHNLLERNKKVLALDNFSIGTTEIKNPNIIWSKTNLLSDELSDLFKKYTISGVIHCAAHPGGKSLAEPVEDVEVNALGSMKLFYQAALQKIPVVYLSSSAVYGPGHPDKPLKENDQVNPGTIYGACKIACENYLKILGEGYGLPWTVLRLFATYGAGHQANTFQGIVNVMMTQLMKGPKVVVKGSLARVRGLIYVKDAAKSIVDALYATEARGEIINIAHPEAATIKEIIETIIPLLSLDPKKVEIIEEAGTVGDPLYNYADCSKAQKLLKLKPHYSLKEGLSELVQMRLNK